MEALPRLENPSYSEMKQRLVAITERVNVITQKGQILANSNENDAGGIIFADNSWAILMPNLTSV